MIAFIVCISKSYGVVKVTSHITERLPASEEKNYLEKIEAAFMECMLKIAEDKTHIWAQGESCVEICEGFIPKIRKRK